MKKSFSSNNSCDLDLFSIMLKHKPTQAVAIPKICMKLYQNQAINESIGLLTFGWLVVLGLTALSDSISVYIGPSPREREIEEKKDRRE